MENESSLFTNTWLYGKSAKVELEKSETWSRDTVYQLKNMCV